MREPRQYEAPLCAEVDGDLWFPERGGHHRDIGIAKRICGQCIHRDECAEWGLTYEKHGIWGGLTELDRRILRKRHNIILPKERSA